MKRVLLITILFFSFSCSSTHSTRTEQTIFNKVTAAMSSGTADDLSELEYDKILKFISSGKGRWIDLYPHLNKKPFLGMTSFQEGLNISMAYALAENPSAVFKFVNEDNIDHICGIPFIEPTHDEINEYYEKVRAKMMAVRAGSSWGNKCLFTLDRMVTSVIASSNQ